MKKFWLKICTLALILTMSAGFTVTAFAYDKETITYIAQQYVEEWNNTDFQQYIDAGSLNEEAKKQFTDWQNIKGEVGKYVSITNTSIEEEKGEIVVIESVKFEKGDVNLTIHFNKETAETNPYSAVTQVLVERAVSGGSTSYSDAALNTLMGMGMVFVVLILISFIISLLKYVPALLAKREVREEVIVTKPTVKALPKEELTDDTELAAVITAAIMASMAEEAPADGFVVRSIRRRR